MEKEKKTREENEKLNALIMQKSMRKRVRQTVIHQNYQNYGNYGQANMNMQRGHNMASNVQFDQIAYPNPQITQHYGNQYMMNQQNMGFNRGQYMPNMNDPRLAYNQYQHHQNDNQQGGQNNQNGQNRRYN